MTKLIAVDVDGTLLNSKHEISEKTKNVLIRAIKEGHKVVIASGRQTAGIEFLAKKLEFHIHGGLVSGFNGGQIKDIKTGEIISNHTMDINLTKKIIDFSKDLDIEMMIPHEGKIYTNKKGQFYTQKEADILGVSLVIEPNLKDKINFPANKFLFAQTPEKIDSPAMKLYEEFSDVTEQVKSTRYYYEIMPKGLSKGNSLIEISNIYNINKEDIIAFGDEMNDESMIKMAGCGVAMGNAVEKIKEIADFITLTNDEDGIAHYLEKFIF